MSTKLKSKTSARIFTEKEAYQAALEYFNGDDLAARVWVNKYALKDSQGNIYEETPDAMHRRIAKEIARIEQKHPNPMTEEEDYDLIKDIKHIKRQRRPMAGLGNKHEVSPSSNCCM